MSDAAIASIVTGIVTVTTLIVGFLTMLAKLKYGAKKVADVEEKLDDNTAYTVKAADAADKAREHAETNDEERMRILKGIAEHDVRIGTLEGQMREVCARIDGVTKIIDSTRHEMRGHLQAIGTKLDLMVLAPKKEPG